MKFFLIICCVLISSIVSGQFAPQVGLPGCTAVSASSSEIVAWATGCAIWRGYLDIDTPTLGDVTNGDSSDAIGPSDGAVVSLGDSGIADLTFEVPICDGPGADFAVFENGFSDPENDSFAFLELGFVEVSSDGINYFRFPSVSYTPSSPQIPGFGVYMNACLLYDLAGKYIGGYGTPFDLQELAGVDGLDITHITHVRVVDVIGDVGLHATHDSKGNIVNDPFPTPFATGGFDLDAVAVIHQATSSENLVKVASLNVYPNPATNVVNIVLPQNSLPVKIWVSDATGRVCSSATVNTPKFAMDLSAFAPGIYLVTVSNGSGERWDAEFTKQ